MAAKTVTVNNNNQLVANLAITQYPKGGSSIALYAKGVNDPRNAIFNKGPRNIAMIFGKDEDGDPIILGLLDFIKDTPYYAEALANLRAVLKQLPKG